ncbi:MAG: hypothetical protein F6K09_02265 [Merismopedia sp. SIO2A8]|nr:hypothetical protein [Merismopedia sp. SIO2A8]
MKHRISNVAFFSSPEIERFLVPIVGEVETEIGPNVAGRVKFQGSSWPARWHWELDTTAYIGPKAIAHPHEQVTIIGRFGLMLLCVPLMPPVADENTT